MICTVWQQLQPENQKSILEFLASGKGTITHEKSKNFDSLKIAPDNGDFFEKTEFFSKFRNQKISNSRLIYKTL